MQIDITSGLIFPVIIEPTTNHDISIHVGKIKAITKNTIAP